MRSTSDDDREVIDDKVLLSDHFTGSCRYCGQKGRISYQCKNRGNHNGGTNGDTHATVHFTSYCKTDHEKDYFQLKKRNKKIAMKSLK
jgi:hypothetical protein